MDDNITVLVADHDKTGRLRARGMVCWLYNNEQRSHPTGEIHSVEWFVKAMKIQ